MSKQPPSSGRFGHPALDKILQTLAKAQIDATKAQARGTGASVPSTTGQLAHTLGMPMDSVHEGPTWDDMLYEAMTRQRTEWMKQQGIRGLDEHGVYRTPAQRQAMSPWKL